jgi:hypothetical protein
VSTEDAEGPAPPAPARAGRLSAHHPPVSSGPVFAGARWRAEAVRWLSRGVSAGVTLLAVLVVTGLAAVWLSPPATETAPALPAASGAR